MSGDIGTLNHPGERKLAGRVAGVLWLLGAASIVAPLVLPHGVTDHWEAVVAIAGAAIAWGVACLLLDWSRLSPLVFHISSVVALGVVASAVALTGGSDSPTWILLFYVAAFCGYFYAPREAVPYLLGCVVAAAMPFVYDENAVDEDLTDFLLAAPAFLVVGGVVAVGKRRLVDLRREAHELALRDPLTGLANRRALIDRISGIGGDRRSDATGLLMVDLDDFKDANTLHGHPVGDRVLQEAAGALRGSARAQDLVGRMGGDEFAVVVETPEADAMGRLAERVLTAIHSAGASLELSDLHITASAGWAVYPDDAGTGEELVRVADTSLRAAKARGKGQTRGPLARAADGAQPA